MTAKVRWNPAAGALAVGLGLALATAGCGNQSSTPRPSSASGGTIGAGLQAEFETIVERVGPSVVLIQTSNGLGSGVVYDAKGMVSASNGRQMAATLVGSFPVDDLAVIRAERTDLPPATFGDSSTLKVGMVVLAIGNPLGLQSSVTEESWE
jgi:S1-C subfamily serine protease